MKFVILDGYTINPGDLSWEELEKISELRVYDRTPYDAKTVIERIGDAEAVFTSKVPITSEIMDACPELLYIGVLATGYNNIDVAAAKEHGITVTNIPNYSTDAVAQMTFSLILELTSHVGHYNDSVKSGDWIKSKDFCYYDLPIYELAGKTIGIIGFGNIGRAVGRIAKAFGMRVLAAGSRPCAEGEAIAEYCDYERIFAESDIISLHAPLLPATKGIICKENIDKMKDGVIIVNTARGPLIVEEDLVCALDSGKVAGAGMDVVSVEPMKEDNPLMGAKNCIITPHIAWASTEARKRLIDITVDNVLSYVLGTPKNCV